jgi:hypothetical protein
MTGRKMSRSISERPRSRYWWSPIARSVPRTVATIVETVDTISVFQSAAAVSALSNSRAYHWAVNPVQRALKREAVKD